MANINLGSGIISGEAKRNLECYIDSRFFRQRKSYDEYYVDTDSVELSLGINDLMILAEDFDVRVMTDSIYLEQK